MGAVSGRSVLGVDGCPGGWVGALVGDDGAVSWGFWPVERTAELLTVAAAIAIDMPIGLPEAGSRRCDGEARARLGRSRSSVFPVPSRPVLDQDDYPDACSLARARGEAAPSRQLWGLRPRIRLLDQLLGPGDQARVVECHPEVVFRLLAGEPVPPKRSAAGVGRRLALLGVPGEVLAGAPGPARPDDALDALGCAWTARRWLDGEAQILGGDERDGRGLRMQIVA